MENQKKSSGAAGPSQPVREVPGEGETFRPPTAGQRSGIETDHTGQTNAPQYSMSGTPYVGKTQRTQEGGGPTQQQRERRHPEQHARDAGHRSIDKNSGDTTL